MEPSAGLDDVQREQHAVKRTHRINPALPGAAIIENASFPRVRCAQIATVGHVRVASRTLFRTARPAANETAWPKSGSPADAPDVERSCDGWFYRSAQAISGAAFPLALHAERGCGTSTEICHYSQVCVPPLQRGREVFEVTHHTAARGSPTITRHFPVVFVHGRGIIERNGFAASDGAQREQLGSLPQTAVRFARVVHVFLRGPADPDVLVNINLETMPRPAAKSFPVAQGRTRACVREQECPRSNVLGGRNR